MANRYLGVKTAPPPHLVTEKKPPLTVWAPYAANRPTRAEITYEGRDGLG